MGPVDAAAAPKAPAHPGRTGPAVRLLGRLDQKTRGRRPTAFVAYCHAFSPSATNLGRRARYFSAHRARQSPAHQTHHERREEEREQQSKCDRQQNILRQPQHGDDERERGQSWKPKESGLIIGEWHESLKRWCFERDDGSMFRHRAARRRWWLNCEVGREDQPESPIPAERCDYFCRLRSCSAIAAPSWSACAGIGNSAVKTRSCAAFSNVTRASSILPPAPVTAARLRPSLAAKKR